MKNNLPLLHTWRWFGPQDAVSLAEIRQAGVSGVVTALHHVPCGEVWSVEEIQHRKNVIEEAGLRWTVVESVNVHESIKTASSERDAYIDKYKQTLQNLAGCHIHTVCYNFMPVLDWTRTHLAFALEDGATALRYEAAALAAFDLLILQRAGAAQAYTEKEKEAAQTYLQQLSDRERDTLQQTIMAGLPGTDEVFTLEEFRKYLSVYQHIDIKQLKENLAHFLRQIIPIAEACGILMCIHPDDPPFPILGLPRVVCHEQDLQEILEMVPSVHNGITFCTGSLGARADNDLPGMLRRLGSRIHFLHLRNVQRHPDGSFYEADHLDGSVDMFEVMKAVVKEQQKRVQQGRADTAIPMRADHGHQMVFDAGKKFYPGYSAIGRLKGLAELRGLEMGVRRSLG